MNISRRNGQEDVQLKQFGSPPRPTLHASTLPTLRIFIFTLDRGCPTSPARLGLKNCNTMKNLESFTQPEILQQIGSRRLAKLFDCFRDDLKTGNILLPNSESENGSYFDSLAPILGSSTLPDRLRAALFTLEAAARSENQDRLDSAIQRRIPSVSLSSCCALDRALELWFHAPEQLFQFQTAEASPSPPAPRSLSGQEEGVRGEEALSNFRSLHRRAPIQ